MKGRFEAVRRRTRAAIYRMAALAVFYIAAGDIIILRGQELPPAVTAALEQMSGNGVTDTEPLARMLEEMLSHPVDINAAGERELERIPLLTQFQIASLLDYRREFGGILSVGELALVDGFNTVSAENVAPFVTFGGGLPQAAGRPRVRTQIRGRCGSTGGAYLRYGGDYGEVLRWGVTAEQDAGEKAYVPDFLSGFVQWAPGGTHNVRVLAGDFSVRLGQGLVFWNGFTMKGVADPSAVIRSAGTLSPYTSSDELDFCRGAGVQAAFGRGWEAALFGSFNAVDARCDSVYYYTLPDDGMHDTQGAVEARHSMKEFIAGGNIGKSFERLRVRLNGVAYSYTRHNGRSVRVDNAYQMYDGWWGNVSLDWLWSVPSVRGRVFGEAAVDADLHPAVVCGAVFAPVSSLEASVSYRYYHPLYISPHAGGHTASAGCYNEQGALVNVRWNAGQRLVLTMYGDVSYHSYPRYLIEAGSWNSKVRVLGEWRVRSGHTVSFQGSVTAKSYVQDVKYSGRGEYRFLSEGGVSAASRVEVSVLGRAGYLVYQEVGYAAPSGVWKLYLRGTAYHVDEWDNRIYCYQRGLAGTFSVPAAYGSGAEVYLLAGVRPVRWLEVSAKGSAVVWSSREAAGRWSLWGQVTVRF